MKRKFLGGGSGKKGFSGFPVSAFAQLQDTPHSYAGKTGNILQVNAGETGLEFIPGRSQANGVAALDAASKVPAAQIPSIAITEFLGVVANQAAMLLLTGEIGDWCIRSDLSTTWIITANDGHLITDWTQIVYPINPYKVLVDIIDATPDYLAAKIFGSAVTGIKTEIGYGASDTVVLSTIVSPFSWSNPIISFWDASGGAPPLVLGARYIISVAGLGFTKDWIYECLDGLSWTGNPGVLNQSIWNNADKMLYVWSGVAWVSRLQIDAAAATGSLRTLGMGAAQAAPGDSERFNRLFYADQLQSPNNADWAVNALAPASPDNVNNSLIVRLFDDTTEEGVGFVLDIPANATGIRFYFKSGAYTAPGVAKTVQPRLYTRQITDNAAPGAWSGATALTPIGIPLNVYFQYDSQSITLAALGLTAGKPTQFELTRFANASLVGDWKLLALAVAFY